ncbi:hypothetical protein [Clostridium botulinum]|uniref:Internalin G-like protein n=1 Tax=Clostridium botulinum TaxID=1491 RepID=A0A9Q1UWX8_CLOBO|nr:hypothetical protein [Clostridium botulinum]AEB76385.1 internalin G related protein [Clostridium botulinum BKT015925]KEI01241.1 internalin G-like protein [Clostridium botulinum D str. 16868]KEI04853.1 internalin G-like protein [Clostridium botulinum C/D str. Sp77]KLU75930.1 internalin G-like protein [Clostridium botulinum V891]KOA75628.1 internalin G-like protein [Clostridium botulinum]
MAEKGLEYYLKSFESSYEEVDNCISLIQSNISGGRITYEQIDELKNHTNAVAICISGLTQDTFDYFVENYGPQFKVINFWKCPLVSDFTKLEQLPNVEYLLFFWNKQVTHLWDLSKNIHLKGISFDDFTRMHTLKEIPLAPALEELYFGDKVWNKYVFESLKPLCSAQKLKNLIFSAKKINDSDIKPLATICNLVRLEFPPNLFTTEQVAWLTANTKNVNSSVLSPYLKLEHPIDYDEIIKDVLVIGKRKPFLNSNQDKKRLDKYENNFYNLVKKYCKEKEKR